MSENVTITVGKFDTFSWIRCQGRCSFKVSSQVKDWTETQLSSGVSNVVLDLGGCSSMDSTFMGNIAGLHRCIHAQPDGEFHLVGVSQSLEKSLDELGIATMLDINADSDPWSSELDEYRSQLNVIDDLVVLDHTDHVYETHKTLCEMDDGNVNRFRNVINVLEAERANQKQQ